MLIERTHNLLIKAETAGPAKRQRILDEVVTSHLWLAETLARRFMRRGEDPEDLLQVARTGLVEACQRFDPHQGSFIGFAVPTITGVLKRHFRDHGWVVRPPRPTQELASIIWRQWPTSYNRWAHCRARVISLRSWASRLARFSRPGSRARATVHPRSMRRCPVGSASAQRDRQGHRPHRGAVDHRRGSGPAERRRAATDPAAVLRAASQSEIAEDLGTSQMQVSRLQSRLLVKMRTIISGQERSPAAS